MESGIYSIWNLDNDKVYIGSGVMVKRRWGEHIGLLRKGNHHSQHLQRAYDLFGESRLSFEVIEYCEPHKLIEREQYWIDGLAAYGKTGYNVNPKAGSSLGVKRSAETRAKISEAKKGKPAWNKGLKTGPQSPELIAKRIAPLRGKLRPPEVAEKISETHRASGHRPTPAVIEAAKVASRKRAELRIAEGRPTHMTEELRKRIGLAVSAAKQANKLKSSKME